MGSFEHSWQEFVSGGRLEYGGHTDPDFRGLHTLSASFIIPVTDPEVLRNLSRIRDALRPFPFIALHPNHFLHISVGFAGFVSEDSCSGTRNTLSRDEVDAVSGAARDVLEEIPPFEVELANLNAFPSVAYVEIHDEGGIPEMAKLLGAACKTGGKPGKPHMTIAYFHAPDGTEIPSELPRAIAPFREYSLGRVSVDSVELTILRLKEEYPRLEVVEEFRLRGAG